MIKPDPLYKRVMPRVGRKLRGAFAHADGDMSDLSERGLPAFLGRIKGHDFSLRSDLELRERMAQLAAQPNSADEPDMPTEVFAIVREAIRRRLGFWQALEPGASTDGFANYRKLALGTVESPGSEGAQAVDDLNDVERALVNGMAHVMKKGQTECSSDILMGVDFYRAISKLDSEDMSKFEPTDEQIIAGCLLYTGHVVEMDSGEGKTVAAAFPAASHAVRGRAVHIVTSNDYLAARDAEFLAPVYESLGLTVGYVVGYMSDEERRHAYQQNIVYGTMREFAFDYLRDNLKLPGDRQAQASLDVMIVDEADHALIDQASTPLIISGEPVGKSRGLKKALTAMESLVARQKGHVRKLEAEMKAGSAGTKDGLAAVAGLLLADPDNELLAKNFAAMPKVYGRVLKLIDDEGDESNSPLTAGLLYVVDPRGGSVRLTEIGHQFLEDRLGPVFDTSSLEREVVAVRARKDIGVKERKRLADRLRRRIDRQNGQMNQLYQLLKALVLIKRDVDYVVDDGKVVLVDELTGRTLPDNIYNRGLHAAVQAKERVAVEPERETLAQISVQGFVKQYSMVAGLTGTAMDARDEFMSQYGLTVTQVPSTRPRRRTDFGTRVYRTNEDKTDAIADEIRLCRQVGRPVLVGTLTIEQSERMSKTLTDAGISHHVLNGANEADEASIIRDAGSVGAVTLATNMAGRGTDISLQPDLNEQIIRRYVVHVQGLLNGGGDSVQLDCSTAEERSLMSAALLETDHLHVTEVAGDGLVSYSLIVSRSAGAPRGPASRVEFGLGLHVIGTELNQSSRIDRQLRGRSGRQGVPGTTRFIVSMDDQLLAYRSGEASYVGDTPQVDTAGRTYFHGGTVQRYVQRLQRQLSDDEAFDRSMLNEYMRIQEAQTDAYYRARRGVFSGDSFHDACERYVGDFSRRLVGDFFPDLGVTGYRGHFGELSEHLSTEVGIDIRDLDGVSAIDMAGEITDVMLEVLDEAGENVGAEKLDMLERELYLQSADQHWRQHIGYLQELMLSVSFSGQDRKRSAAEYAVRSHQSYESLGEAIVDDFVQRLFSFSFEDLERPEMPKRELEEDIAGILA